MKFVVIAVSLLAICAAEVALDTTLRDDAALSRGASLRTAADAKGNGEQLRTAGERGDAKDSSIAGKVSLRSPDDRAATAPQRDAEHDDADRYADGVQSGSLRAETLRNVLSEIEESAFKIPRLMDGMLESALSSLDRASGGALSGLASTKVDFGQSADKSRLIVRVHMPATAAAGEERGTPRTLHATVVGQSHLRMTVEMTSGAFTSQSTHTFALPAKVSKEGVEISSKLDGTVHISLRVLEEGGTDAADAERQTSGDGFFGLPFGRSLFPALFARSSFDTSRDNGDAVLQVPSSEGIERCRDSFRNERLLVSKCLCDVTPDVESRAVCYGSLISKSVSMARRLEMDDFATSAKHNAIECAAGGEDKAKCLEQVAKKVIESLYHRKGSAANLTDRIRQAIESDDDGPSDFQPSTGLLAAKLLVWGLVLMTCFWIAVLYAYRRRLFGTGTIESLSQLSSVLAQRATSMDRGQNGSSSSQMSSGANERSIKGARGSRSIPHGGSRPNTKVA